MLMVNAFAGVGKTTTVIFGLGGRVPKGMILSDEQKEIIKVMRSFKWQTAAAMAFNTSIADELKRRVPPGVVAATSNSFGNTAWRAFAKSKVDGSKTNIIFRDIAKSDGLKWEEMRVFEPEVVRLVSLLKGHLLDGTENDIVDMAEEFNIELTPQIVKYTDLCFQKGIADHSIIDFDDQIFMPIKLNLPIPQYDLVVCDECVPSWTPVMMGDGSSKNIVDVRVGDVVRSFDTKLSIEKNCRVVATQKLVNSKPLVKIKVRHTFKTNTNVKANFVVCTTDHKIWTTNRGWVPAGNILVGDTCIIETAAKTSQKGKISKEGKNRLSSCLQGNKRGIGNSGGDRDAFMKIRKGNGHGPTIHQELLLENLSSEWVAEYSIKIPKEYKYQYQTPPNYKGDLVRPDIKFVIELDGASHVKREDQDKKKDKVLGSLGWKVLRIKNKDLFRNFGHYLDMISQIEKDLSCPDGVNCPRPAIVESIEATHINDPYVYDITVEDCHNFYANGILVHNCQDLNFAKQELAIRMARKWLVAIGDSNQAIYGFSGADSNSMFNLGKKMAARGELKELRLTITRRCPKAVVRVANRYVPDLRAHKDAPEGEVRMTKESEFLPGLINAKSSRMILCRTNAPLTSLAFKLIANKRRCFIQGKDIGTGLVRLVEKAKGLSFQEKVAATCEKLNEKIMKLKGDILKADKIEAMEDKIFCIQILATECESIEQFKEVTEKLFKNKGDENDHILSSVHKAKGLEHPHVCIYKPSKLPMILSGKKRKQSQKQVQQEYNLAYVAYTRSQDILEFVEEEKEKREYNYDEEV